MNIRSTKIREVYPDFIKRLRISTKDFNEYISNPNSKKLLDETNLEFIKSCYYDDIQELEEIIFFTSYPFYEFSEVYKNIICPIYDTLKYISESKVSYWENIFWSQYERLLKSEFYEIKFDDSKFYFKNFLVPINLYDKNQINIIVFDFVNEVDKFIKKNREEHPKESDWQIFRWLMNDDFLQNHHFDEEVCYFF